MQSTCSSIPTALQKVLGSIRLAQSSSSSPSLAHPPHHDQHHPHQHPHPHPLASPCLLLTSLASVDRAGGDTQPPIALFPLSFVSLALSCVSLFCVGSSLACPDAGSVYHVWQRSKLKGSSTRAYQQQWLRARADIHERVKKAAPNKDMIGAFGI